jgi:hypothetical protein
MKACSARSGARAVAILAVLAATAGCAGDTPTGVVPIVLGRSTFDYNPSVGHRLGNGTAAGRDAADGVRPGTTGSEGASLRSGE